MTTGEPCVGVDVVATLLAVGDGQQEYARALPETGPLADMRVTLLTQAAAFRAAAQIAGGDMSQLWGWPPRH